jgi:hypothetical protein
MISAEVLVVHLPDRGKTFARDFAVGFAVCLVEAGNNSWVSCGASGGGRENRHYADGRAGYSCPFRFGKVGAGWWPPALDVGLGVATPWVLAPLGSLNFFSLGWRKTVSKFARIFIFF